jgi:hypothetical protein
LIQHQVTNLNPGYVLQQQLDPAGQYILHTRMPVAQSIQGFPFSTVISRQQQRELEELFRSCVEDWSSNNENNGTKIC